MKLYNNYKEVPLSSLIGKTISQIHIDEDFAFFQTICGSVFCLGHNQECCEEVYLEQCEGDKESLIGVVIDFHIVSDKQENRVGWSFYKLTTTMGYNTFRFMKDLDTNYSTEVSFYQVFNLSLP